MDLLRSWAFALGFSLFTIAWVCIVLWGVQRLWPRGAKPSKAETWKAAKFWAVFLIADAVILGTFRHLDQEITPLFDLKAGIGMLPWWAALFVGPIGFLIIYDFFNYWMHRAQHKWFWRQHRIHHSITHLSAFNGYFHPTEPLFRLVSIYVPLTVLFGYGGAGWTVAMSMLTTAHGYYVHSPTALNFGPLRAVFVDNAFHRVHHSVETQHFDKNFGAFTTLWDRLFGTAYFPAKDEWPDTGVWDYPEAETLRAYVSLGGRGRAEVTEDSGGLSGVCTSERINAVASCAVNESGQRLGAYR